MQVMYEHREISTNGVLKALC